MYEEDLSNILCVGVCAAFVSGQPNFSAVSLAEKLCNKVLGVH